MLKHSMAESTLWLGEESQWLTWDWVWEILGWQLLVINALEKTKKKSLYDFKMKALSYPIVTIFAFFFFFFWFLLFRAAPQGIWRFPGQGSNQSFSCQPMPQPQQRRIQAVSATYTTAHGNARSLTHWARPGIIPATSWFLVRFINQWATAKTPRNSSLESCGGAVMNPGRENYTVRRLDLF